MKDHFVFFILLFAHTPVFAKLLYVIWVQPFEDGILQMVFHNWSKSLKQINIRCYSNGICVSIIVYFRHKEKKNDERRT